MKLSLIRMMGCGIGAVFVGGAPGVAIITAMTLLETIERRAEYKKLQQQAIDMFLTLYPDGDNGER